MRGQKATLYEGGIRMPFMVRWPARIKPGSVNNNTVITSIDIFPTVCALTGTKPYTKGYTLDGIDMSKSVLGKKEEIRKSPMFWEFGQHFVGKEKPKKAYQTRSPNICMREGDWKLLVNYDGTDVELYNLKNDVKETTNVAEQNPAIKDRMKKAAIDWYNEAFRKHAGELVEPPVKKAVAK